MSALVLASTLTAVGPGLSSSFLASGGTPPYIYSVRANGAGGTIDSSTGWYTAPENVGSKPQFLYDTVGVVDSSTNATHAQILVGTPLILFCDILQTVLTLPKGRVYLWDQKLFQPSDSGLYIAVSVPRCKSFASNALSDPTGENFVQYVNMQATLGVDIISRDTEARDRKEEVVAALISFYSQQQQNANGFSIGRLPTNILNLSQIDGAAIPYRYQFSVNMLYAMTFANAVPYYTTFETDAIYTNP